MPIVSSVAKSLPPSGTASGDLSGSYPGPTVAKVNGVAVTGTPSTGYVPTATSASAATWQAAGGSQTFKTVRFPFAWNTPNIATTGVSVYVPTARDFLLFFTFSVTVAFDGTTPHAYLTSGDPTNYSLTAGDLSVVDLTPLSGGILHMSKPRDVNLFSPAGTHLGAFFDDATPLLLFLRDENGTDPAGSTVGAGEVLLHISPAP